ncbi:Slam-dependent surface lipoprotein [Xenorhabdus sp. KK7.4]|uniref:Slam-dependent surface lipoprotein n=1 Tax=Xenorhabdus sp. KK7.4 TaxID=1851572 RepID=UPI000C049397|nr:Slam-dependent surface lipoprotein [Xenorhabdus sp. KK7.4]PHM54421.1 hypothetical protein Xekk_02617 [Xenorhabdus sp. KK7.4]
MKIVNIFIIAIGTLGLITQAHAKVGYGISQTKTDPHLVIGEKDGEPALGISSVLNGQLFSASNLKNWAKLDHNGVYEFETPMSGHHKIDIVQIPDTEVYFGEWAHGTGEEANKTHTVFYAGKDVTTNMPKSGKATYSITGINQYDGSNLLHGKATADFDSQKMDGSFKNNSTNIDIHADINQQDASFSGKAKANGSIDGITSGRFFGDGASVIAGQTHFDSDSRKDTAFGGSKQ